jgi:outer membrane immunogenic protein
MRIISSVALVYVALSGIAIAADMRPPPAPPAAAPYERPAWSGFYFGGNGGGGFGNADNDFRVAGGPTFASVSQSLKGALGGGQIGYNWQSGAWVLGVEADFQASSLKGHISTPCLAPFCALPLTASYSQEVSWFGTVRGRIGYAQAGWLLYATGGYAYGRVETNASASAGALTASSNVNETDNGWTVGGGTEVMLLPQWSVKVEALYVDLGTKNTTYVFAGLPTINDSKHVTFSIARAGLNFRF